MSSPKEIAENILKCRHQEMDRELARAYLELEAKHLELENKISILKQDLESEKRNHKIFREAADGYIEKLKKSREALRKFVDHCCSWNEGEVVTGLFDSPWTAREAREALKADDELMKEGEE